MPKYKIHFNGTEIVLDAHQFKIQDGFHIFVNSSGSEVARIASASLHAIINQDILMLQQPIEQRPIQVTRAGQ